MSASAVFSSSVRRLRRLWLLGPRRSLFLVLEHSKTMCSGLIRKFHRDLLGRANERYLCEVVSWAALMRQVRGAYAGKLAEEVD